LRQVKYACAPLDAEEKSTPPERVTIAPTLIGAPLAAVPEPVPHVAAPAAGVSFAAVGAAAAAVLAGPEPLEAESPSSLPQPPAKIAAAVSSAAVTRVFKDMLLLQLVPPPRAAT
jgi:hypothetical protein